MGELAEDFAYMKEQRRKHKDAVTPSRPEYAAKVLRENGHTVTNAEPGQLLINGYITYSMSKILLIEMFGTA